MSTENPTVSGTSVTGCSLPRTTRLVDTTCRWVNFARDGATNSMPLTPVRVATPQCGGRNRQGRSLPRAKMQHEFFARAVKELQVPLRWSSSPVPCAPAPHRAKVRVDPAFSSLLPGDVVVYQSSSEFVTHRVLHVVRHNGDGRVIQRGDSSRRPGVIALDSVVGKVTAVNSPGPGFPVCRSSPCAQAPGLPPLARRCHRRRLRFGRQDAL